MPKFQDLTGQKFNRLTVIECVGKNKHGQKMWLCRCECGVERVFGGSSVSSGNSKSCGCLQREAISKIAKTHGLSGHPLYRIYYSMVQRCTNKKNKSFLEYGKRGISVCEEWLDVNVGFTSFYEWCLNNGYKEGLQIDRRSNDGNYEPSNCRFVTNRDNCLNQRPLNKNNKSGYEGVCLHKNSGRWRSRIMICGKELSNGYFDTKRQALEARNNYIRENNLEHEYKIQEYKGE